MARKRYVIFSNALFTTIAKYATTNMNAVGIFMNNCPYTLCKTYYLRNISKVFFTHCSQYFNFRWNMALEDGETEIIKIPLQ